MPYKAYVINKTSELVVCRMFHNLNIPVVNTLKAADIVVFTGGADILPTLYGQSRYIKTGINDASKNRDIAERNLFNEIQEKYPNIIKVGICRGGQLLNVLSGGDMFQDVNNHTHSHIIYTDDTNHRTVWATSTHHQMMIPDTNNSKLLAWAHEVAQHGWKNESEKYDIHDVRQTEVVWYPKTKSLCFQPHPEYHGSPPQLVHYFKDTLLRALKGELDA